MKRLSCVGLGVLSLVLVIADAAISRGASKVVLGHQWPASQYLALDQIDHRGFDQLLRQYVDSSGNVDYQAWKASPAAMQTLDAYLTALSRGVSNRPGRREAALAFWINAYNAVTIKGILREYPTTSIRNHTAKLIGYNIWDDLLLAVGGTRVSLNQMEHEILRKMGEPRIHFAIVCASIGCPRLRGEAYAADRIDQQLTENARAFFADPTKFNADIRTRQIRVSPILKWFGADFGASVSEQMAAIAVYLSDAAAQQLARSGAARVAYLPYNWDLNDQAKRH